MRFLYKAVAAIVGLGLLSTTQASSRSREPLNYLTLVETPEILTHNHRVTAYSSFDLTFDLHNPAERFKLVLEPNHDILTEQSQIQFLDKDGNIERTEPIVRDDHKVYQGESYIIEKDGTSTHVGWARISIRRDGIHPLFSGAFSVMGNQHHIQLKSNFMSTRHAMDPELEDTEDEYMVVFRDSDIGKKWRTELRKRDDGHTCSADKLAFNNDLQHPVFQELLRRSDRTWGAAPISHLFGKRQSNIDGGGAGNGNSAGVNLRSTIGDTTGCPTARRVALLGAAADCGYTASFNSTDTLRQNIIDVVNTASDLYQSSFNITLGLSNLTVSAAECPGTASSATPWNVGCSQSTTIEDRLNTFSQWRGGLAGDSNAYWSLFTTCNTGAEVGLAWLGQLCNQGSTSQDGQSGGGAQTVTGANVVARTSTEWQVFAHETGHTFGAVHDCDSSLCQNSNAVSASQCCPLSTSSCDANAQYIMNPYSSDGISHFSPCTIGNICSALGRNSVQSSCLTDNRGVVTITGHQCGNGIVEDDEDCDCGGTEGCAGNSCCDPTTCRFTSGSVCDPTNEGCCTSQCQFSASGTVCRASTGVCDPEETCSGNNATCPTDQTAEDGTGCGDNLACASGQCTSRDQQCKTVMGSYTQGNDTYSCRSDSCTISCASPDFGPNVCYGVQQNFLDGTPCGGGGHCSNGVCRGSTVGGEIRSWIDNNRTLVIVLATVLGSLLLLAILGCCIRVCRRRRRRGGKRMPKPVHTGGWNGPPIPPAMAQRGYNSQGSAPRNAFPRAPPPTYAAPPYSPQYGQMGSSVRYA